VLTRANTDSGIQKMLFDSRGEYAEYCYYKHGDSGGIEGQMLMKGITNAIEEVHLQMISNTYHYLDWNPEEIDHLICHQVGQKSHESLCEIAEVAIEKAPISYRDYGNITTATIPLNLHFAKPNKGDKILLIGGGSGLSSYQGGIQW
ncbi:ketoacyl-ACP synthase III, partial [Gammaproteobacteria bacterium]|nr:ketoacyl-ACP synthase III [Gammaproteobacteria bacterium]